MLFLLLSAYCGAARAAMTSQALADLAAMPAERLEAAYHDAANNSTDPQRKLSIGLVLADHYADFAPQRVEGFLERVLAGADLNAQQQQYVAAIRCNVVLRLTRGAKPPDLCLIEDVPADEPGAEYVQLRIMAARIFHALQQGEFSAALEGALHRERKAVEFGHPFILARSLHGTAAVFTFSNLHSQALDRYVRAYEHLSAFSEHPLSKIIAFNLGMSYRAQGEYPLALQAFQEGYDWAVATGQAHRALIAQVAMATVLQRMERQEEALTMITGLLAEPVAGQNPDTRLHAYQIAGDVLRAQGQLQQAVAYLEAGAAMAKEFGSETRWGGLELVRLQVLEELNQQAEALAPARELVAFLQQQTAKVGLRSALMLLARLERHAGNLAAAYANSEAVLAMESTQQGAEDHRKLALLEVANELQAADRELAMAQAAQRELRANAERNQLIGWGGALLFVLTLAVVFFDLQRRKQRRKADAHRENSKQLAVQVQQRTREVEEGTLQRMRIEEARKQLELEVIEQDRMRSLGQLTGGVAHDFNNLLTVVSGSAELLFYEPSMPVRERQELVSAILEAATTGGEITTGLLAYARRQLLSPEPISLRKFFARAQTIFQQTLGEGMTLKTDIQDAVILADHGQLMAALLNVLTNAREASDGRGVVELRTLEVIDHGVALAQISIRDFGCGMDPQQAQRATEPFYSTKQDSVARGLGLSRVYGFVQQSGGEMEIHSAPERGTNVLLNFPISGATEPQAPAPLYAQHKIGRVLLVDDNADVRATVAHLLESLGHTVTTAADGESALRMLAAEGTDLLVTDVLMPGRYTGAELARRVRTLHPDLPVLMISGFAEAPELEFPMLAKPFSVDDLKLMIDSLGIQAPSPAAETKRPVSDSVSDQ